MAEAKMERIMAQREEDDKELFCEIMNRIQDKFDAWQTKLVEEERDQAVQARDQAIRKQKEAMQKNLYLQHLVALLASSMSYEEALMQCTSSIPTDAIHG